MVLRATLSLDLLSCSMTHTSQHPELLALGVWAALQGTLKEYLGKCACCAIHIT